MYEQELAAAGWERIQKKRNVWDEERREYDQVPYDDGSWHFIRRYGPTIDAAETIDELDLRQRVRLEPESLSKWGVLGEREPSVYRYCRGWSVIAVGTMEEIVALATGKRTMRTRNST